MKKFLSTLVISFILISPTLSDDNFPEYSNGSLDTNIFKFNWKIDEVRSTSKSDIYYLKKWTITKLYCYFGNRLYIYILYSTII